MKCTEHPEAVTSRVCERCGRAFCDRCLVNFLGKNLCVNCKTASLREVQHGQTGGVVENASFGPRFLALLIDAFTLAIPTYAIQLPLLFLFGRQTIFDPTARGGGPSPWLGCGFAVLFWFIGTLIHCVYFTWMIGARGQTLGKMALRLKVVRGDLSKMSYGRAFGRYWGCQLSSMVLCIGYLMVLFQKDHLALHDMICDTRVIKV